MPYPPLRRYWGREVGTGQEPQGAQEGHKSHASRPVARSVCKSAFCLLIENASYEAAEQHEGAHVGCFDELILVSMVKELPRSFYQSDRTIHDSRQQLETDSVRPVFRIDLSSNLEAMRNQSGSGHSKIEKT